MNDETTIKVRLEPDGRVVQIMSDGSTQPVQDNTDWARVDAMSDEELEANALSDPDNPPLTEDELAILRREPSAKVVRSHLNLTQEEFSEQFQIPLGTLRDWEQGKKWPDSAARALLRVIEKEPDAVRRALAS